MCHDSALYAGVNRERKRYCPRHWRIGRDGRFWTLDRSLDAKEVLTSERSGNVFFCSRWNKRNICGSSFKSGRWPTTNKRTRNPSKNNQMNHILELPLQDDSTLNEENAEDLFWTITSQTVHDEKRDILPIPRKFFDVFKITHTSFDVSFKKKRIDYWNVDVGKGIIWCTDLLDKIHLVESRTTWPM